MRGDLGITYDVDVLRLRDEFQQKGLYVGSVVITQFLKVTFHALHTKTLLYLITNSLHREYIFAQEIQEWADIDNRTDAYFRREAL